MGFYSFIVLAPDEVPLPAQMLCLDRGRNVFNATIDDIEAFRKLLRDQGVEILKENRLDEYEVVDPNEHLFDDKALISGEGSGTAGSA
jgi:hypothetical protein